MAWLSCILVALTVVASTQGYTCPAGASEEEFDIGRGDSEVFKTQARKKYGPNVNCTVTYNRDAQTCRQLKFACNKFKMGRKDFLYVKKGKRTLRFGGKRFKAQVFNGDISVRFVSDKKKHGPGAICRATCNRAVPTTTTAAPTPPPSNETTTGPAVTTEIPVATTTIPNSGGAAEEKTLTISYSWSQETNYQRQIKLAIPATSAGEKVPVVFHLHGNGGQGNTRPFGNFLGDKCIIVAPDGYERSWNVYAEKSKADDVQFILDIIAKIGAEVPAADINNVNIAGSSNGAALTYQLLINTGADRPFRRAFPMVSSLIGPQYNNDQFWKFSQSAAAGSANNFDTAVTPAFDDKFEYAHFHGTLDGTIKYEGQNPGPAFLNNAVVISAQETDFLWAKAMGYTGSQLADSDGVSVGTTAKPTFEYKYLDGRARHYKLVDEGHGTGPSHPVVQSIIREMILGPGV